MADENIKNNIGMKFAFRSTDINKIKKTLEIFGLDSEDENNQKRLRNLENGQCLFQDLYGRVGAIKFHVMFNYLFNAFDTRPADYRKRGVMCDDYLKSSEISHYSLCCGCDGFSFPQFVYCIGARRWTAGWSVLHLCRTGQTRNDESFSCGAEFCGRIRGFGRVDCLCAAGVGAGKRSAQRCAVQSTQRTSASSANHENSSRETVQPEKKNLGQRVGERVGKIVDTPSRVRDKAVETVQKVKDAPTNAEYAVHSNIESARESVWETMQKRREAPDCPQTAEN